MSSSSAIETNGDHAAANAPEPDPDNSAPEWRGEQVDLEVAPGSGMQTFYDSSPPEAIYPTSATNAEKVDDSDAKPQHSSRKTVILLAIAAAILALVGLGVGLGVGLTRHGKMADDSSKSAFPPANPSITSTSMIVQASQTPAVPPSKHAILAGTSIAAVTLPNGDRRIFFQEKNGIIRQAKYSASAKVWAAETTTNFQVADDARNNTPLAAISADGIEDTYILYYVSSTENALSSRQLSNTCDVDPWPCGATGDQAGTSLAPNASVALQSRHLTAVSDGEQVFMSYEDSSDVLNVMYGAKKGQEASFEWRNMTSDFSSAVGKSLGQTDLQLAHMCSSSQSPDLVYCFITNNQRSRSGMVELQVSYDNVSNIQVLTSYYPGYLSNMPQSDWVSLSLNPAHSEESLWFNQTKLKYGFIPSNDTENSDQLLPDAQFPFHRLGLASEFNGSGSYVYHQVNDSIIAEEFWSEGENFWQPSKNISIET